MALLTTHEDALLARGCAWVAGIDEVGRGPLAGPVMAAAVRVPDEARVRDYLRACAGDSKQINAARREALAEFIEAHCAVGVGSASVAEIDALNIRQATFLAMRRALENLCTVVGEQENYGVAVDGNALIAGVEVPQVAVVKGDGCELAIACASLVAKVRRDALMVELGRKFPAYGWAKNAGYGTAVHLRALQEHGVTEHHRASFAPVRELLEGGRDAA